MSAVLSESLPALRPMEQDDLAAVLEIESLIYDFPWTERIFTDCLRMGYTCLVYDGAEDVTGYGIMSIDVGECYLLNIGIHPDHQRRGHGSKLIARLLALGHKHNARMAFLEVRRSNHDARRLYVGLGFTEIGMRKKYYPARNGKEDAIVFAKVLNNPRILGGRQRARIEGRRGRG